MRASEFMTPHPVTVRPDSLVRDVAETLIRKRITAMPVVDDERRLVGIVAEADLMRARITPDPRRHLRPVEVSSQPLPATVAEVMTRDVLALPDTADESDFARLMLQHGIKSVPVVAEGRLVGIVSRRDLLRPLVRDDETLRREVSTRLGEVSSAFGAWTVDVEGGAVHLTGPRAEAERRIAEVVARTVPGVVRVAIAGVREPSAASSDHGGLRILGIDECLERLRSTPVGRVAFVADGQPMVLPVNHGVYHSDVVFRTTWGSKLFHVERGDAVAFEADYYESARHYGWSVLVRGTAQAVYDDETAAELETVGVTPWADAVERPAWVRIRTDEISGREIVRKR